MQLIFFYKVKKLQMILICTTGRFCQRNHHLSSNFDFSYYYKNNTYRLPLVFQFSFTKQKAAKNGSFLIEFYEKGWKPSGSFNPKYRANKKAIAN